MLKIIALALFLHICIPLHTHQAIEHLITTQSRHFVADADELYFEDMFTDLISKVDYVNRALITKDANKFKSLITKTSQIQNQISELKAALLNQHLPVTQSSKICVGVTKFNRTQLRKHIISIQQAEKDAVNSLSTCLDCSFISDELIQIKNISNNYIQNLNKTLDGYFCHPPKLNEQKPKGLVNLNNSYFKSNLQAKNWYYGATTASDYKIYIFKRSASYNLTSCPLSTPFVNDIEQKCFNCPDNSIFNLGSQHCDSCKANQILNIQSGQCDQCVGQKKKMNGTIICKLCILTDGQLFNKSSGKCYKCDAQSYLDTQKMVCVKINCETETPRFNRSSNKCEKCGISEIVDPNDVTKCIKTNFVGMCPPDLPLYDLKTKQCVECPAKMTYIRSLDKCMDANSTQSHMLHHIND